MSECSRIVATTSNTTEPRTTHLGQLSARPQPPTAPHSSTCNSKRRRQVSGLAAATLPCTHGEGLREVG